MTASSSASGPATVLLLTRHGQSTWNAERRWQGQADPPLSAHGREQAAFAATRIGVTDAIVSSPQDRALSTAMIISEANGVGPVLVHDDLRERSAGSWSGLTRDDIEAAYPGWLDDHRRPDDFETDHELIGRVLPALRQIADEMRGSTVLVLCHGGVIKAIEEHHGVIDGRVPNLSGRVVHVGADDRISLGEQVRFLDEEIATGGDGNRI
ncbi:MAG: histidine phosphatase family protein [Acidimicrobiales bacterium]